MPDSPYGAIAWQDLTVENADELRDFYAQVVGWQPQAESMGAYSDYNMIPAGSDLPAAGICHARGENANIPPVWLIYIKVESAAYCAAKCVELGGKIVDGPRPAGSGILCIIKDPAGAVCGLFQPEA